MLSKCGCVACAWYLFNEVFDLKPTSAYGEMSTRNGGLQTADQPKRRFGNRRSLFLCSKRLDRWYTIKARKNPAHLSKFLPVQNG
jgi:hypothetical protein